MRRPLCGLVLLLGLSVAGCGSAADRPSPMPRVSGAFGSKPVVRVPAGQPVERPTFRVLSEGDGDRVAPGEAVVAHVDITVWRTERDYLNTYDTAQPTTISLAGEHVADSWNAALVGQPAGSRVLLVAPARQGFGPDGMPPAQLRPTDTLVVVFDILGGYPPGDPRAEPASSAPSRTGDGRPVHEGDTVVLRYAVYSADTGTVLDSSYRRRAPNGFTLESGYVPPGWLPALDGTRVGSRVRFELPESATRGVRPTPGGLATPTGTDLVYVLDVVDVARW